MLNNFHFERCVSNRNARGLKFVTFTFTGVAPPRSIEMGLANSIETFNFFTHLESTQINTSSFQCLLEIYLFFLRISSFRIRLSVRVPVKKRTQQLTH